MNNVIVQPKKLYRLPFSFESYKVTIQIYSNWPIDILIAPNSVADSIDGFQKGLEVGAMVRQSKVNLNEYFELPLDWGTTGGWQIIFGNPGQNIVSVNWQVLKHNP